MACSGCGSTTPSNPPSSASTPAPHTPNKALYKEPHDHLKFDNEVTMINAEVIGTSSSLNTFSYCSFLV